MVFLQLVSFILISPGFTQCQNHSQFQVNEQRRFVLTQCPEGTLIFNCLNDLVDVANGKECHMQVPSKGTTPKCWVFQSQKLFISCQLWSFPMKCPLPRDLMLHEYLLLMQQLLCSLYCEMQKNVLVLCRHRAEPGSKS